MKNGELYEGGHADADLAGAEEAAEVLVVGRGAAAGDFDQWALNGLRIADCGLRIDGLSDCGLWIELADFLIGSWDVGSYAIPSHVVDDNARTAGGRVGSGD